MNHAANSPVYMCIDKLNLVNDNGIVAKPKMNMEPMSFWHLVLNNPEWSLVIVGLLTFFVIGWQAVETKKAAQATRKSAESIQQQITVMERQTRATENAATAAKDSAEATKQSVEMMISKERARLRVELKPLGLELDFHEFYTVDFTIAIDGPTSAYNVESACTAYVCSSSALVRVSEAVC